jgi:hypothetical protein
MSEPTWELVYENKPHYCTKPQLAASHPDLTVGCIIKCTECGQHWKYIGTDSGMQWDPYPAVINWEKISPPMLISRW